MKKDFGSLFAALLCLGLLGIVSACNEKTPAEKVAQKIDKAVDDSRAIAKDIKEDVSKKRP